MTRSWWMASALATSLLVGGCARQQVKQDEVQLGRLPIEEKQEIFTAQHNVTVAEANKATADKAAKEMQAFVKTARDEVSAARARLQAARSSLQLARRTRNSETVRVAEQQQDVARRQMASAQAKREYAERLAALRSEQSKLADRQADAAQTELTLVRAGVLQRNNIASGENMDKLRDRREQVQAELAAQERKVSGLRDEANDLQMVWEQRRQDYNVAARDVEGLPPLPPPSNPEQFRPEPLDLEQGGPGQVPQRNERPRPRSNSDRDFEEQRPIPPESEDAPPRRSPQQPSPRVSPDETHTPENGPR
jgi:hypothetical protein